MKNSETPGAPQQAPLVSIITPGYNSGKYIKETVESALAQTYPNIEIIVKDSFSKDGTEKILEPYVKNKSITFIREEDDGPAMGRNQALKRAHGAFIAFLDSDDVFLPTKIEKQVAYLEAHPGVDVCYSGVWHFYDDAPEALLKMDYKYYSGGEVFPQLLRKTFIAPSMVMIRRDTIDRIGMFDESYRRSEDWEYWTRLAYHGAVFHFLPEPLLKIRIHRDSYSSGWGVKSAEKETTLRIFENLDREMSPVERRRYGMGWILFEHRAKLWYTYFGNHFPPLQWFYLWLQKNRLK